MFLYRSSNHDNGSDWSRLYSPYRLMWHFRLLCPMRRNRMLQPIHRKCCKSVLHLPASCTRNNSLGKHRSFCTVFHGETEGIKSAISISPQTQVLYSYPYLTLGIMRSTMFIVFAHKNRRQNN